MRRGASLPPLERLCPKCKGAGGEKRMYEPEWDTCLTCDGAGYVPTSFGKRVLELLRHNFRPMLERMQNGDD
jgi:Tryptophan RNA-binding attenuator protein inhibitory protein